MDKNYPPRKTKKIKIKKIVFIRLTKFIIVFINDFRIVQTNIY